MILPIHRRLLRATSAGHNLENGPASRALAQCSQALGECATLAGDSVQVDAEWNQVAHGMLATGWHISVCGHWRHDVSHTWLGDGWYRLKAMGIARN